jgi:hypothetical protein
MHKVLIQLDSDPHPSVFDRVVAVDAGVDHLFSYGGVRPEHVRDLVHGAIFTRGPKDLKNTAIFIGGSDVAQGERLLEEARKHMLPQYRLSVSVMLDSNGANTTAAAAVRAAARHLDLKQCQALVLGGTGPVGQRVALLLARAGSKVRVASRQRERALAVCQRIADRLPQAVLEPASGSAAELLQDCDLVISAGAAGVQLLPAQARHEAPRLRLLVDLNAVPPLGIEGVEVTDRGEVREGVLCYGAIGVGETKMKVHKAALRRLFEASDLVLDAMEIFQIACELP